MLSHILATIREHGLLAAGDRVLVAVSGGPDSTALLHLLAKLAPRLGITLLAATVDHGLRPEAGREAREVARRCRALGIRCRVLTVDVAKARRRHGSLQEAARDARLAALDRAARRLGCGKVALGHTADDQAETVLFRIVRGTGIAGLAGIPYRRGKLVRPLLDVRRAELLRYLHRKDLEYLSDPSNQDRRYARVRIRHDILPLIGRENPRVVEAVLALAAEARTAAPRRWLAALPAGLYIPRRALAVVDALVARRAGTGRVAVRGGVVVVRYGEVTWEPAAPRPGACPATLLPIRVRRPGWVRLGGVAPAVNITPPRAGSPPLGNAACFDPAKLAWPLTVRLPRPGDRMLPRGGRGSRKLSDLLIDAKVPRETRATLPVVCDAGGAILFVPGLRPSEVGRPVVGTREWFEVHVAR